MHSAPFDRLIRMLAASSTRRNSLTRLLGTIVALVSRLGPTTAWAAGPGSCRGLNNPCFPQRGHPCCRGSKCVNGRCRCPKRTRPCRGRCLPRKRCCGHANCPGNQTCRSGRCRCPARMRRCGKNCLPFATCCRGCRAGEICVDGICGPPACGRKGPCRVFVTSLTFTGDLNGIAGADEQCQRLATASQLTRGGTYRAWLSGDSDNSSPARRFTNLDHTGPYVLTDGTEIAAGWEELTSGDLEAPINVTEWGANVGLVLHAWTNTLPDGLTGTLIGPRHCQQWQSSAGADQGGSGENYLADDRWTRAGTNLCSDRFTLYCFEQG